MNHPLDNVFDVETETQFPQILPSTEIASVNESDSPQDFSDDFELARERIKSTLDSTQQAMTELLIVAQSSQHPRSFEVLAKLADTINGLSKQLVDLHKVKATLNEPTQSKQGETKIQNAVFVGSTEQLLQMIGRGAPNETTE